MEQNKEELYRERISSAIEKAQSYLDDGFLEEAYEDIKDTENIAAHSHYEDLQQEAAALMLRIKLKLDLD